MVWIRRVSLFLLFWALSPLASAANATELDGLVATIPFRQSDIQQAEKVLEKILGFYPQDQYYFIFIGRSLTFIRALMDIHQIPNSGIPLSGKSIDLNFGSSFGQELKIILRRHLDLYLPEESAYAGKELVLLDMTASGDGLLTARKAIDWYFNGREILHLLRVSSKRSFDPGFFSQFWSRSQDRVILYTEDTMEAYNYTYQNFDSYAGYGSFNIETARWEDQDRSTPERYQALITWMRANHPDPHLRQNLMCREVFSQF